MQDNGTWRLTPGSTTEPGGSGPGAVVQGPRLGCRRVRALSDELRVPSVSPEPG